jgi:hypothetical protein
MIQIDIMTTEQSKYTEEAAKALGYDWQVVQYFLANIDNPAILKLMWGNNSAHYTSILTGTATKEKMEVAAQQSATVARLRDRESYVLTTSLLMLQYLSEKKPRRKKNT